MVFGKLTVRHLFRYTLMIGAEALVIWKFAEWAMAAPYLAAFTWLVGAFIAGGFAYWALLQSAFATRSPLVQYLVVAFTAARGFGTIVGAIAVVTTDLAYDYVGGRLLSWWQLGGRNEVQSRVWAVERFFEPLSRFPRAASVALTNARYRAFSAGFNWLTGANVRPTYRY